MAVDFHTAAIEGFFSVPLEHLSAVPSLAATVGRRVRDDGVIIAPDLGAAKLAERYADLLGLPTAILHKTRVSGEEVRVRRVIGKVRDLAPVIVDTLLASGCIPEMTVVTSHALLVGRAVERLQGGPVRRLITTDSVPPPVGIVLPLETVSLAPLLADSIRRLHDDSSLDRLIEHR